jgi:hypothetical protein
MLDSQECAEENSSSYRQLAEIDDEDLRNVQEILHGPGGLLHRLLKGQFAGAERCLARHLRVALAEASAWRTTEEAPDDLTEGLFAFPDSVCGHQQTIIYGWGTTAGNLFRPLRQIRKNPRDRGRGHHERHGDRARGRSDSPAPASGRPRDRAAAARTDPDLRSTFHGLPSGRMTCCRRPPRICRGNVELCIHNPSRSCPLLDDLTRLVS